MKLFVTLRMQKEPCMTINKSTKTVGYILKKFPVLSETFILNELLELESRGVPLHIFSLERPDDPRFHENLPRLKSSVSYVPDYSNINSLWKHITKAANYYGGSYKRTLMYVLKCGKPSLLFRFFQCCYIANHVKRFRVGHLHAHFATRPTSVAFLTSMVTDIPYSFSAHAMDIFKNHLSINSLKRKIRKARFVVTVSNYNLTYITKIAGGEVGNIVRIYNGIKLDQFEPHGSASRPTFTFLCVARLVEKKGHRILIEACDILRKKGPSFECLLVGKGKLRSPIRKFIKEKKLSDYVKLLGPLSQNEVINLYHTTHSYVLPCIVSSDGNRDGLPVSIVEALASGLPVITTPMTGNAEVVNDGYNGLLVPCNNAEALAVAMQRLIQDKDFYRHLKKNSIDSVKSHFDIHKTIKTLRDLFEETLT